MIATGAALPKELSTVDAYYVGHKDVKGMFAVDAGSTQAVAQVIQKYKLRDKGVKGGGYDLLEPTMKLLADDQLDFTIDQQPYLQGFFPVLRAVPLPGVEDADGRGRHQHRPEVPRQGDGGALRDDQVALRGQLRAAGVTSPSRGRRRPSSTTPARGAAAPARPRTGARGRGALGLGRRLLTLREGSVIVITLLVAAYFAATTDAFLTWDNFKTLLPYFAPFAILAAGEVFLMINGEIDLSIGAVYLFAPFMFHEFHVAGLPLLLALALRDGRVPPGRPGQRVLHHGRRHQLVHHHARDAARRSPASR